MILLVDCGSRYSRNICSCLDKLHVPYEILESKDMPKASLKKYVGLIISGSPLLLSKLGKNEREKHLKRFNFVKTCSVPVLGICHGHQVIGLLFGSDIKQGEMIAGNNAITIHDGGSLLRGLGKTANLKESHTEYISLPNHFMLLAGSSSCKVECMKHKSKNIFGVQFHPEISGEQGFTIFKNFCRLCQHCGAWDRKEKIREQYGRRHNIKN